MEFVKEPGGRKCVAALVIDDAVHMSSKVRFVFRIHDGFDNLRTCLARVRWLPTYLCTTGADDWRLLPVMAFSGRHGDR